MSEQKRAPRRMAREAGETVEVSAVEMPETETIAPQSSREIAVRNLEAAPISVAATPAAPDVFPDFAVTLQEANRRVRLLKEFVREHMVEGEDYGVIPGASPKPTLFKAGAEKLNAIFGLAPLVEITGRVEDWDTNFLAYEVKVTLLNKRTGAIEAEGIGHCNSRERKYKSQDATNVANTILKMAKKRALVDATLSATRASGIFTQDLEDLDTHSNGRGAATQSERNGHGGRDSYGERSGRTDRGVSATRSESGARAPRETNPANGNGLTEAQRGAILAMANKAFGRNVNEEMARLVDKPIAQLSKSEASSVIDHLRGLLPERENAPREGRDSQSREAYGRTTSGREASGRETSFQRAGGSVR